MDWFEGFGALEWTYFVIAVIGTVLLLISVIMMIVGASDGGPDFDTDADMDGELDTATDTGLTLFSTKALVTFFAIGGWTGVAMLTSGIATWISIVVSLVVGLAAYFLVWGAIKLMLKLQDNGNLDYAKGVGMEATVYVSIPPARSGRGKITFNLQGRYTEADAMTDEKEKIPVDCPVTITSGVDGAYIVERKNSQKGE